MIACFLTVLALVSAGPDGGAPRPPFMPGVLGIKAPLGRVGDIVEEPRPGGYPANEKVLVTTLEGCPRPQAIHLSRFVSGVALAGLQVEAWLGGKGPGAPRGVELSLFRGKKRLGEAARRARQGVPLEGLFCEQPVVVDGWKLEVLQAPGLCPADSGKPAQNAYAFGPMGKPGIPLTALVSVAAGRANRCLPRISGVLFDEAGKARLRYHADYGDKLEVQVVGDGCQSVELTFDAESQRFLPSRRSACSPSER